MSESELRVDSVPDAERNILSRPPTNAGRGSFQDLSEFANIATAQAFGQRAKSPPVPRNVDAVERMRDRSAGLAMPEHKTTRESGNGAMPIGSLAHADAQPSEGRGLSAGRHAANNMEPAEFAEDIRPPDREGAPDVPEFICQIATGIKAALAVNATPGGAVLSTGQLNSAGASRAAETVRPLAGQIDKLDFSFAAGGDQDVRVRISLESDGLRVRLQFSSQMAADNAAASNHALLQSLADSGLTVGRIVIESHSGVVAGGEPPEALPMIGLDDNGGSNTDRGEKNGGGQSGGESPERPSFGRNSMAEGERRAAQSDIYL
jgi:hypothetical protein